MNSQKQKKKKKAEAIKTGGERRKQTKNNYKLAQINRIETCNQPFDTVCFLKYSYETQNMTKKNLSAICPEKLKFKFIAQMYNTLMCPGQSDPI